MKLALVALAVAGAGLVACAEYGAPPPPPPPGPMAAMPGAMAAPMCFRTADIRNHTIGDDHTIFLNVPGRAIYRVTTRGACLGGAVSSDPLIMRQPPGSSIVCRPIDLDISISKGGFATPCIVDSITPLSPEEAAALPPRLRP